VKSYLPLNGTGFEMAADRLSHLLPKLAKIRALGRDPAESRGAPTKRPALRIPRKLDLKDDFVHALTVR